MASSANEPTKDSTSRTVLAQIVCRSELLRRSDWMTGLSHSSILVVAFLAVVVVADMEHAAWPILSVAHSEPWLNVIRLGLLSLAAFIFISAARRNASSRHQELDFLRLEISELERRASDSHAS